MKIYIYRIYFPASDKCYIGQTNDLQRRMKRHFESGSVICNALYKYDDWQVSVLHTCKSRDEANKVEIEEIRNYNSVAPNGYNLTHGGGGGPVMFGNQHAKGMKHSKEWCENKSEMMLGNKFGDGNIGHHQKHTKEACEKISAALIGTKHTEEFCINISDRMLGNQNSIGPRSEETKLRNKVAQNRPDVKEKKQKKRTGRALANIRLGCLKRDAAKLEQELKKNNGKD